MKKFKEFLPFIENDVSDWTVSLKSKGRHRREQFGEVDDGTISALVHTPTRVLDRPHQDQHGYP
jgi:hypothetical protein